MNFFNEINEIINEEGIGAEIFNEGIGDKIKEIRGNGKIKKLVLRPIGSSVANYIINKEEYRKFKTDKKGMGAAMSYKSEILALHKTLMALEFFEAAMKNKTVSNYVYSLKTYNYTVAVGGTNYIVNIVSYLKGSLNSSNVKALLNRLIKDFERYIKNDAKSDKVEKYTAVLKDIGRKSEEIYPGVYAKYKKNLEIIKTL